MAWIFGVASGLGAFSTLIAFVYKFFFAETKTPYRGARRAELQLLVRVGGAGPGHPLAGAALSVRTTTWGRAVAAHVPGVLVFTVAHAVLATSCRFLTRWAFDGPASESFWMVLRNAVLLQLRLLDDDLLVPHRPESCRQLSPSVCRARADGRAPRGAARRGELQALQRQLHPHFLFNTLHTISALIHRDATPPTQMLRGSATCCGMTLDRVGHAAAAAERGTRFPREVPRNRTHAIRGSSDASCSTSIRRCSMRAVPSLVLQPLVENTMRHGIAPKVGGGRIDIMARRDGDHLVLDSSRRRVRRAARRARGAERGRRRRQHAIAPGTALR